MFSVPSGFGTRLRRSVLLLHSSSASYSASAATIQAERTIREGPRNDWRRDEIKSVYDSPVLDLLFHGVSVNPLSFVSYFCIRLKCFIGPEKVGI